MLRWRVLSLCVYHTVLLHPYQNSLLCSTVYNTLCTFVSRLRVLRFLVVVELPFFVRYPFRSCAMSLRVVLSLLRLLASGLFWFSFSAACDRVILSAIPRLTMMDATWLLYSYGELFRCGVWCLRLLEDSCLFTVLYGWSFGFSLFIWLLHDHVRIHREEETQVKQLDRNGTKWVRIIARWDKGGDEERKLHNNQET